MARNFRGGSGFTRPENALKRADELENVGQKSSALQALHDIITSKSRHHRTWSKTYETIMFKLIDLCVEMRKRNQAKEALMQYRNMCQAVNINSLEEVIKYYLKKANEKAEEAQLQALQTEEASNKAKALTLEVEDLEEEASPEDIMLSYVSGEKSKDRTDRELVTPWFKFLWEAYRSVLEILRTNPKLEPLYAMTAQKAFQFCLQYKRNMEFRRLCDILRQHLTNMAKYREQRDITAPESMQLHLETRFEQLRVACELELWAEAFRTVEDVQNLVAMAKKPPKQQMMATYYARLTQIFAVSESHLYHAYAWLKLFTFSRSYNKGLTQQDLQMMACSVLLACLSILPYDKHDHRQDDHLGEQEKERNIRMANIFGFAVDAKRVDPRNILTRSALLASIQQLNLLSLVPPEIKQAYDVLIGEFDPLELCHRLAPLLESISQISSPMSTASPVKDLSMNHYVPALKNVAVVRMLKQVTDVYSSMRIPQLAKLVPFMQFGEVETLIVDAVRFGYLTVRIDHCQGVLDFGALTLESERIRNHLSVLARRLTKASSMMDPSIPVEAQAKKESLIQQWLEKAADENKRAVARKFVIEKRKEEVEAMALEIERQAEKQREQALREAELLEERRRREDAARREKERIERELEEQEMAEARALLDQSKVKKNLKEGEKLDKKALMQEALNEKLKEQAELQRKLQKIAKTLDHLERARREEEFPFLEAAYAARLVEDKLLHEETQRSFMENHRKAWEIDIVDKKALIGMLPEREEFMKTVMERRRGEFEKLRREREAMIKKKKEERKFDREVRRRQEYIRQCRAAVEARLEELQEIKKKEEEERKKAELAAKQKHLDEIAAKQRAREEEIERKKREQLANLGVGSTAPAVSAPVPAPAPAPAPAPSASKPSGGYVPPHLRKKMQEQQGGAEPAPAATPPAAAAASADGPAPGRESSGGGAWRSSREPPAADRKENGAPPPRPGAYVPPRRESHPDDAPRQGGYRPPSQRGADRKW